MFSLQRNSSRQNRLIARDNLSNWALILIRSEDLKLDAVCFPIVKMTNEQAAREVIIET